MTNFGTGEDQKELLARLKQLGTVKTESEADGSIQFLIDDVIEQKVGNVGSEDQRKLICYCMIPDICDDDQHDDLEKTFRDIAELAKKRGCEFEEYCSVEATLIKWLMKERIQLRTTLLQKPEVKQPSGASGGNVVSPSVLKSGKVKTAANVSVDTNVMPSDFKVKGRYSGTPNALDKYTASWIVRYVLEKTGKAAQHLKASQQIMQRIVLGDFSRLTLGQLLSRPKVSEEQFRTATGGYGLVPNETFRELQQQNKRVTQPNDICKAMVTFCRLARRLRPSYERDAIEEFAMTIEDYYFAASGKNVQMGLIADQLELFFQMLSTAYATTSRSGRFRMIDWKSIVPMIDQAITNMAVLPNRGRIANSNSFSSYSPQDEGSAVSSSSNPAAAESHSEISNDSDKTQRLVKLAELYGEGLLTLEEWNAAKRNMLGL